MVEEAEYVHDTEFHAEDVYRFARYVGFTSEEHLFLKTERLRDTWTEMGDVHMKTSSMNVYFPLHATPYDVVAVSIFDLKNDIITVKSHVTTLGTMNATCVFERKGGAFVRRIRVKLCSDCGTISPTVIRSACRYVLDVTVPRVMKSRDRDTLRSMRPSSS